MSQIFSFGLWPLGGDSDGPQSVYWQRKYPVAGEMFRGDLASGHDYLLWGEFKNNRTKFHGLFLDKGSATLHNTINITQVFSHPQR